VETKSEKRVTRKLFRSGEQVGDEDVEVTSNIHVFETEPAYVRVSHGMTSNMGNFESLRIDVAVTMPCYAEDIQPTREELSEFVAECLELEVSAYRD
jgi:hypothetical protein